MKKTLSILLIFMMCFTLFVACGQKTNTPVTQKEPQKPLVVVGRITPKSFDVLSTNIAEIAEDIPLRNIYDTLTRIGEDGDVIPWVAESWEENPDDLTGIVHLRQDVVYHDGSKMTSADIKYYFDTLMSTPQGSAQISRYFTDCEVIDDYTIKLTKTNFSTKFADALRDIYVVPKESREKNIEAFGQNPIGSGPYKFDSQDVDGTTKLVAFENHFMGEPNIKEVVIRPPMNPETAIIALENGEVDFVRHLPILQLEILESNDNITVEIGNLLGRTHCLYLGATLDLNLKKAIFHAVNRENAVVLATNNKGIVANNVHNTYIMDKYKDIIDFNEYDPELAKEYLAKSSYDTTKPLTFSIMEKWSPIAQSLQADLEAIGLMLDIETLDGNAWYGKFLSGPYDISIFDYRAGPPSNTASTYHNLIYLVAPLGVTDEFVECLNNIATATNQEELDEVIIKIIQLIYDNAYLVPIFDTFTNIAYSNRITKLSPLTSEGEAPYFDQFELSE